MRDPLGVLETFHGKGVSGRFYSLPALAAQSGAQH